MPDLAAAMRPPQATGFGEHDLDRLETLLESPQAVGEPMPIDVLHGFLSALAAMGGKAGMPSDTFVWLPRVWGLDSGVELLELWREVGDIAMLQESIALIVRLHDSLLRAHGERPWCMSPLVNEIERDGSRYLDGSGWAKGFASGAELVRTQAEDWRLPGLPEPLTVLSGLGDAGPADWPERDRLTRRLSHALDLLAESDGSPD